MVVCLWFFVMNLTVRMQTSMRHHASAWQDGIAGVGM
jgi:hypothetical protein